MHAFAMDTPRIGYFAHRRRVVWQIAAWARRHDSEGYHRDGKDIFRERTSAS